MISILIIDDQNSVLQNLKSFIELEEGLEVVGTAKDGQQGIQLVEQLQPDVAIIDLTMPIKNGIETTYLIAQNYPQTKVLIFTGSDAQMLNQAILAGAKGYLFKDSSLEDLIGAIHAAQRNSVYIGEGILNRVQLSSLDSHSSEINQINLWLTKEVINWLGNYSGSQILTTEEVIENLGFDPAGLLWLKDYLCQQEDTLTVKEELKLKAERMFIQIENSIDPEQELTKSRPQIYNWLQEENSPTPSVKYLDTLQNNSQILQTIILQKTQKILSVLCQKVALVSLLECLHSVEKYLSKWQHLLMHEYESNLVKENSAWHSYDHLITVGKDRLPDKHELCQKAVIFIYKCKIDAELSRLVSQIISQAIQELKIQLDVLSKTNDLLEKSKQELEQHMSETTALTPSFEEIQQQVDLEQLKRDLEKLVGQPLSQWGAVRGISASKINIYLLQKLRPTAHKTYSNLRKEALAVSFLKQQPG